MTLEHARDDMVAEIFGRRAGRRFVQRSRARAATKAVELHGARVARSGERGGVVGSRASVRHSSIALCLAQADGRRRAGGRSRDGNFRADRSERSARGRASRRRLPGPGRQDRRGLSERRATALRIVLELTSFDHSGARPTGLPLLR